MMSRIDSYDPMKGDWMYVGVYDEGDHSFTVKRESKHRVRKYGGAFGIGEDALLDVQHRGCRIVRLYLDGNLLFTTSIEAWLTAPSDDLEAGLQHFLGPKPSPPRIALTGALTRSQKDDTV
jgi:hypothetical protein